MKNFITSIELDSTKTYDKYVDVVVKTEKSDARFMEKLPAKKSDMMDVVYMMSNPNTHGKITSVEIVRTSFSLKAKWNK